jgi:flotillin
VAEANAESIRKVNEAIREGGESYFRYRQIEMLPEIAPSIAQAQSRLVTIAGDNDGQGAARATLQNVTGVIQTVLAAQLVSRQGLIDAPVAATATSDSDKNPNSSASARR